MGERIKDITEFNIGNQKIVIELNEGYDEKTSLYDIHFHCNSLQYYLSNSDFVKLATAMISARDKLIKMKKYNTK